MIGIEYTSAYAAHDGIARYVRELVDALAALDGRTDYRLFVSGARPSAAAHTPGPNFSYASARLPTVWFNRLWYKLWLPIPVELWTGRLRLYHATNFTLPPTLPGTKTIVTVHDLSYLKFPQATTPALKRFLDGGTRRSTRRADLILADSQATKTDLVELYKLPPEKIRVLLSGVNARFRPVTDPTALQSVREKYGITAERFVLAIGTVQPRKNYERLVRAFALLPLRLRDVHLVIAGKQGWLSGPIYQAAEDHSVRERVHFTRFVDDEDLPTLYSAAWGVAYPSLYEGFGLPILEAMACGTPVLTSWVSSMLEVAGEAAILVDPYSIEAIQDGLERLIDDDAARDELRRRGLVQAAAFTWTRAAQQLLATYQTLGGGW
jgi:glycosyltransferase involved in cell wall biosynthesis